MIRVAALAAAALLCACSSTSSPAPSVPPGCSLPISSSALPPSQVIDLGSHRVGDQVSFDVPANTGSVTILHQAKSAGLTIVSGGQVIDNEAVPSTITMPGGQVAFDIGTANVAPSPDGGTDPSGVYAFFGGNQPITAAFTMPNTSRSLDAGVPSGTWKFVVNDFAYQCSAGGCQDGGSNMDTYQVSVLTRPLPGGSNLDLAFYLVAAGLPFTASNASSSASVSRMVATFTNIYKAAGITVRNVSYYDVSAADRTRFGTNVSADKTGPCDELDQMFTLSGAHPGNTINLFLVQAIRHSSNNGGTVVGVDGSIPGPATLSGTVHSGAAVSLADLFFGAGSPSCAGSMNLNSCGADFVAYVAAHETGHFLGLFHTTEMEGDFFDPITDTPKCPCLSCAAASDLPKCGTSAASGQPLVLAHQCVNPGGGCGGGDDLMFWVLEPGYSRGTLSAEQAKLMKLNPAVQ